MLYISSLCTILPEPLRSTAPHQLCHVRHVRFGLLMTSLMLPHCLLIPRACCDPIATCCAACDAAAANALPCDAQTRCELRIQLRTCGTLCANCASTPLHSSHFPYALPQHHLPLQDPSLDPMRVLHRYTTSRHHTTHTTFDTANGLTSAPEVSLTERARCANVHGEREKCQVCVTILGRH